VRAPPGGRHDQLPRPGRDPLAKRQPDPRAGVRRRLHPRRSGRLLRQRDLRGAVDDDLLGLFQVNHLHNVVHLLIGLALVATSRRLDTARGANLAIGATYLVLGVIGWFIQDTGANVVALNEADHLLHLASGALLTAVAVGTDRTSRPRV
jgi:hypothetical protein